MKNFKAQKQQGAVLIIALVMLLVLTVLAVTNMRGVTLESRITANRIETSRLQSLADAALREGEFRFYGEAYLREKLEPKKNNCTKDNKLNIYGNNKPCMLEVMSDVQLTSFFKEPIKFLKNNDQNYSATNYSAVTGAAAQSAGDSDTLAWMPYRGLDAKKDNYFKPSNGERGYWNGYPISPELCGEHSEYSDVLEGKGSYCFLVTGQANDQFAAQSTIVVNYLGLN